jgi:hypothetical protein
MNLHFFTTLLGQIRENAPSWCYSALHAGWWILTALTIITLVDLAYRLFRTDHGLKP